MKLEHISIALAVIALAISAANFYDNAYIADQLKDISSKHDIFVDCAYSKFDSIDNRFDLWQNVSVGEQTFWKNETELVVDVRPVAAGGKV